MDDGKCSKMPDSSVHRLLVFRRCVQRLVELYELFELFELVTEISFRGMLRSFNWLYRFEAMALFRFELALLCKAATVNQQLV